MRRLRTLVLFCLLVSVAGLAWRHWTDTTSSEFQRTFTASDGSGKSISYLVTLPPEYGVDDRRWPLILFLHGAGERGSDLEKVKGHGPLEYVEKHEGLPFLIVSPQAPPDGGWDAELLAGLLDDVTSQYPVDTDRVYVTGYSMGGGGTWSLATAHPERFAGIVPVCGHGNPDEVAKLKNVPVWAFHGAKDETIPVSQSEKMVSALRSAGGNATLTVVYDGGHNIWSEVYGKPRLYHWMLGHSRQKGSSGK
ncbi:MAG: prolyl oligopeptidase family serine peptidase [Planctomycetes bacterium]|nr:prolyl oligopeptidase family serine peptidase [Planctomycetota bacterium]